MVDLDHVLRWRCRVRYKLGRIEDIQTLVTDEERSELDRISLEQLLATYAPAFCTGVSGFRGVCKLTGAWVAQARIMGTKVQLGRFQIEEDAARAYDKAVFSVKGRYRPLHSSRWFRCAVASTKALWLSVKQARRSAVASFRGCLHSLIWLIKGAALPSTK